MALLSVCSISSICSSALAQEGSGQQPPAGQGTSQPDQAQQNQSPPKNSQQDQSPQNQSQPDQSPPPDKKDDSPNPAQAAAEKTKEVTVQVAQETKTVGQAALVKARDWETGWFTGAYVGKNRKLVPLTAQERKDIYLQQTLTEPSDYFKRMFAAGIDQARGQPRQWQGGIGGYGERFASIVARDNVLGVQFHPEKSSQDGLRLLRGFTAMCRRGIAGVTEPAGWAGSAAP